MTGNRILDRLVEELARLPGIGAKTAERLAYHLLKVPPAEALALADAVRALKEEVRECRRCFNIADDELCSICADETRDRHVVCVVEQPKDLHVVEQSGCYRGLYHVLGGHFAPLEDRGPDDLTTDRLVRRIREEEVEEVIIATNPDFEGDGTAMLVAELVAPLGVQVSRIARGVPAGSQLEYMNRSIISDAFEGRRSYGHAPENESP